MATATNSKSEFKERASKLANSAHSVESGKFELVSLTESFNEKKPVLEEREKFLAKEEKEATDMKTSIAKA